MLGHYIVVVLALLQIPLYGVRYSMRTKKPSLSTYRERRDTAQSGEPAGKIAKKSKPIFVVQKHNASHLHYDFRLAIDGVLVSWAVPKGPPPRRAGIKKLAVQTEDHPMDYATFEGTIPQGNYGAGTVKIWDHGTYEPIGEKSMAEQLRRGKIEFILDGDLLHGAYVLVQMKNRDPKNWLLLKERKR
jgi:bifunctional non-homologous end joining protein LigD